jgi:hypothetical protein
MVGSAVCGVWREPFSRDGPAGEIAVSSFTSTDDHGAAMQPPRR